MIKLRSKSILQDLGWQLILYFHQQDKKNVAYKQHQHHRRQQQ